VEDYLHALQKDIIAYLLERVKEQFIQNQNTIAPLLYSNAVALNQKKKHVWNGEVQFAHHSNIVTEVLL